MRKYPPGNHPEDHEHCGCVYKGPRRWHQTVLVEKKGSLSFQKQWHHSPAPNDVKRIANSPVFSTTDPSLSSFLRLPPEIRLSIYRLLLRLDGRQRYYRICPVRQQIMCRRCWSRDGPQYPWFRQGLFPAILACCRITNVEGCQVLYGENTFELGCGLTKMDRPYYDPGFFHRDYGKVQMAWPLEKPTLDRIRKATLRDVRRSADLKAASLLPPLSSLTLSLWSSVELWDTIWTEWGDSLLRHIPKLTFYLAMSGKIGEDEYPLASICCNVFLGWRPSGDEFHKYTSVMEEVCACTYKPILERHLARWGNKQAEWEYMFQWDGIIRISISDA